MQDSTDGTLIFIGLTMPRAFGGYHMMQRFVATSGKTANAGAAQLNFKTSEIWTNVAQLKVKTNK